MKEVNLPYGRCVYINVMESFVEQEISRQFKAVPARVRQYLKVEEVMTYALNRLPAIYASSQKGVQYQRQFAQRDLYCQIREAVRQAVMAVQIDPLRLSQPIQAEQHQKAEAVLEALKDFFKAPDLDWADALEKINALRKNPLSAEQVAAQNENAWQPGEQRQLTWTHRRPRPRHLVNQYPQQQETAPLASNSLQNYGWDDVRYRL